MGKLVTQQELNVGATWYFTDAYYSTDHNRYVYDWPSLDYPHMLHIHEDLLSNAIMIKIRKWIEINIPGVVIIDIVDNSYTKYYSNPHTYDNSYKRENKWLRFHFDDEYSATAFALVFSDIIRPITKHHPNIPEDEE